MILARTVLLSVPAVNSQVLSAVGEQQDVFAAPSKQAKRESIAGNGSEVRLPESKRTTFSGERYSEADSMVD